MSKPETNCATIFEPFASCASAPAALADADGRFGCSVNLIGKNLEKQLSPDATASVFLAQKSELLELHHNAHDHVDFQALWEIYYRQLING